MRTIRPIACLFTLLCLSSATAQTTAPVVAVQEDWEMVVKTVDTNSSAPQVITAISPTADLSNQHAVLLLNHRQYPSFVPGGVQLQMWNGEINVDEESADTEEPLSHAQETIKWTTVMWIADGKIHFQIKNGSSTTWGTFETEAVSAVTTLQDLSKYSAALSVKNSGVAFAGNRVCSLKIAKVHFTRSDGQTTTDSTAKVVHQNP